MVEREHSALRVLLSIVFFSSGFAALVFQTIWQRILTLFSGADVYSITIIVASFMVGLGFGSLAGGHLSDRLKGAARLRAFVGCEAGITVFALLSPALYYDVLYVHVGALGLSRTSIAVIVFLVTLVPTFLMGMSLPLLANAVPTRTNEQSGSWIARLYGWNTLGAACGCFVTVTVLFRSFDLRTNLYIGAAISGGAALATLIVSRVLSTPRAARPSDLPDLPESADAGRFSFRTWIALYALSGFIALSLEMLWFRAVGVMIKSNAMTFGLLLAVYLLGLGGGSLLFHRRLARRLPASAAFLWLQAAVPLWAALSFTILIRNAPFGEGLRAHWASLYPALTPDVAMTVYLWLPAIMLLPATIMMGLGFGFLQMAVQTDRSLIGRRLGWLQTANIAGAALGAIVTSNFLLGWLGSSGTLELLALAGALPLSWLAFSQRIGGWPARVLPIGVIGLTLLIPSGPEFWGAFHGGTPEQIVAGEDGSGLIVFRQDADDTKVFLGGLAQSWLPYHGIHTALGALPALLHPRPSRVAVIGLASGDTLFAIGARGDTTAIECIEIMTPQLPTLRRVARLGRYPALDMLLADRRVHHRVADARMHLRRGEQYDIVEADALLPTAAAAGNLYSVEFFTLLRQSLAPGGFAVTWLPTERTWASFLAVFPHVVRFGEIGIGSLSPIALDMALLQDRIARARDYYARGGVDLDESLAPYLEAQPESFTPSFDRSRLIDLNRDLFPKDEFGVPD